MGVRGPHWPPLIAIPGTVPNPTVDAEPLEHKREYVLIHRWSGTINP